MKSKCLLLLLLSIPYFSAVASTQQSAKTWLKFSVQDKFNKAGSASYQFEIQTRFDLSDPEWDELILRPSIAYQLSKKWAVRLGLGIHNTQLTGDAGYSREYRLWQQLTWRGDLHHQYQLGLRGRLEQRKMRDEGQLAYRARPRIKLFFPIIKRWNIMPVISNELFLNLNKPPWVQSGTVGKNRIFLGFEGQMGSKFTYQFGYQNEYILKHNGNALDHILIFSIKYI